MRGEQALIPRFNALITGIETHKVVIKLKILVEILRIVFTKPPHKKEWIRLIFDSPVRCLKIIILHMLFF